MLVGSSSGAQQAGQAEPRPSRNGRDRSRRQDLHRCRIVLASSWWQGSGDVYAV